MGWWSKGILGFCFGPNLGLRLGAGTKLNKIAWYQLNPPTNLGLQNAVDLRVFKMGVARVPT